MKAEKQRIWERYPRACGYMEKLLLLRSEVEGARESVSAVRHGTFDPEAEKTEQQALCEAQKRLSDACAEADKLLLCVKNPADRVTVKLRYLHGIQPGVVCRSMNVTPAGYYKRLRRGLQRVESVLSEGME